MNLVATLPFTFSGGVYDTKFMTAKDYRHGLWTIMKVKEASPSWSHVEMKLMLAPGVHACLSIQVRCGLHLGHLDMKVVKKKT